jgi:hypothetical protein
VKDAVRSLRDFLREIVAVAPSPVARPPRERFVAQLVR